MGFFSKKVTIPKESVEIINANFASAASLQLDDIAVEELNMDSHNKVSLYLIKNGFIFNKIIVKLDQISLFSGLGYVQELPQGVGYQPRPIEPERLTVLMFKKDFEYYRGILKLQLK